jgi:hypothetical protein
MASKKPLVLYSGTLEELRAGDALSIRALDFYRSTRLAAKPVSVAADRCILAMPATLGVTIDGVWRQAASPANIDLSLAASWDDSTYATAANRAGKDFYVYACVSGDALVFLCSANATYPTGYSASTSRKIGGFHCLCLSVGTISGHALTGYATGDILPASVWDLKHRPICDPEGMVYVEGLRKWADIYLASVSGGKLVSAHGGTIADGASATAFDWYDFCEWFGAVGKRLPTQMEFIALSTGSNQGTTIYAAADPVTTGGHSDTASRRMISNAGCEDCCGAVWQRLIEAGGPYNTTGAFVDQATSRSTQIGQGHSAPNRALAGGDWYHGPWCGSRGSYWAYGPLSAAANTGARGVANALEG